MEYEVHLPEEVKVSLGLGQKGLTVPEENATEQTNEAEYAWYAWIYYQEVCLYW